MPVPRLLHSGAFRFAVLLALVFASGSAALLAVVERAVDGYTADAIQDGVDSELSILLGEESHLGRTELVNAIKRHQRAVVERQLRYLLTDPGGRVVAGDLPPKLIGVGWRRPVLRERRPDGRDGTPLVAHGVRLADGSLLVVAGDLTDLVDLRRRLLSFTLAFGASICLLVLVGGTVVGGVFLRRLDGVNAAVGRIIAGRFAQRLPPIGLGREFDRLSANLNAMLDRIEALMTDLRRAATDIAHDLRTPLSRLRQRLEAMRAIDDPRRLEAQVEGALTQVDELLSLFSALLRLGALENGSARALFTKVDLGELVARLGGAYRPEIEDGGRRLRFDVRSGPTVTGDRELLAQAIANLLENAMAHTPVGSRVELRAVDADGVAHLTVRDDGPGIPPGERDAVLRRFYRLDRSRSTPGVGLGLPLVAAVAALHDGTVRLEDAGPGLRVDVVLPLAPAPESSRPAGWGRAPAWR